MIQSLIFTEAYVPEDFLSHPVLNYPVEIGNGLQLECSCPTESNPPTIQWIKIDGIISERTETTLNGLDLFLLGLEDSDFGLYACVKIEADGFLVSEFVNVTDGNGGEES